MASPELINIQTICLHHKIEIRFIHSLEESGLIELTTIQESQFLPAHELPQLEKWVRLYYEMDINVEGIETITHLLDQIQLLRAQLTGLQNRLRFYEMTE